MGVLICLHTWYLPTCSRCKTSIPQNNRHIIYKISTNNFEVEENKIVIDANNISSSLSHKWHSLKTILRWQECVKVLWCHLDHPFNTIIIESIFLCFFVSLWMVYFIFNGFCLLAVKSSSDGEKLVKTGKIKQGNRMPT